MDPALPTLAPADVWDFLFKTLAVVGGIIAAVGAAIGFFLKRYWDTRDRLVEARARDLQAREANRQKQRDILYESLKWFEGGTQNRSIGIAVVNTSWATYQEFRELWIEVLANQGVYLLTSSKQGDKAHEHDNLRRIFAILVREKTLLTRETRSVLQATIADKLKKKITTGLTLTPSLEKLLQDASPEFNHDPKPPGSASTVGTSSG